MEAIDRLTTYCQQNNIAFKPEPVLAEFCTFKTGGPAALLLEPASIQEIRGISNLIHESGVPSLVVGKGSNLLFPDEGFPGVLLHLGPRFAGMRLLDKHTIDCDSGATLAQLCLFAWENGLSGLEFAYGIPGTVGGGIYMNAGAYGGEMKDVLVSCRHLDTRSEEGSYSGEAMGLSYRHSAYSGSGYIITGGSFRLQEDDPKAIRSRMDDYMNRRRTKQPLDYPSAGSTFKRPAGAYASALIDQCGLKGKKIGGAAVSEKHAGFLINEGNATTADIRALIAHVQREVEAKTGYHLECEVQIVE